MPVDLDAHTHAYCISLQTAPRLINGASARQHTYSNNANGDQTFSCFKYLHDTQVTLYILRSACAGSCRAGLDLELGEALGSLGLLLCEQTLTDQSEMSVKH